jgi:digeranylgeranylglycerophospholipid reductase
MVKKGLPDKLCRHTIEESMSLKTDIDVVVAGGSVSGLLAAGGIANAGFTVRVFEDDLEIGFPERCDGLVSLNALKMIGVAPTSSIVQNRIRRAILYSPGGVKVEIEAERQRVLVLDRSRFDQELARTASRKGAEIEVGHRVTGKNEKNGMVRVQSEHVTSCTAKWIIDATGYVSLPQGYRATLPAAKYEVYGSWFDRNTIEMYFDQKRSPGYFTWVIPISEDVAKVGVSGRGGNQFRFLDDFIKTKGGKVYKKTAAQIVVGGPIDRFVRGRSILVGDAAGQAKPTTGGGIYSGGLGGLLAGKCIGESLASDDPSKIQMYEKEWKRLMGREFNTLLWVRRILDRLDNGQIDKIFRAMASSGILERISAESDFDNHSIALLKALGLKNVFQIAGVIALDLFDNLRPFLNQTIE